MTNPKCAWKHLPREKKGILCGADHRQEWLLPWWWSRYSEHNRFPVTFCDFGMSEEKRLWCAERGNVVPIASDSDFVTPRSAITVDLAKQWEQDYGCRVWGARRSWFKKPFALLESPYETGLWIDLDCEILGSLAPLFADSSSALSLVREYYSEQYAPFDPNVRYNGGVIAFKHGSSIVEEFAQVALTQNHLFGGDDPLLSHLIYTHKICVQELPEIYNWRMARGVHLGTVILHWVGTEGKAYIRKHGGLKPSLDLFFQSCRAKLL